jgi:hypothetical protein
LEEGRCTGSTNRIWCVLVILNRPCLSYNNTAFRLEAAPGTASLEEKTLARHTALRQLGGPVQSA